MTAHRAAPGPQLSTGRLRVDAARAIAKLREYQLALRPAWVLEAIRAAVASRATRISLTGDTNDLWLSWDGEPWPAADLPRLFDELVGPEASDARYPVRLLAAAVNSALGMNPAYVDVFAIAATGHAMRARYTPDVLDEPEGELAEAPLRKLAVEPAAPPPGAGTGMAVHFRRRFGVAVLSHLVRELPELELARAACADLGVTLLVRGVAVGRGAAPRDVVRIPLGEGLQGFLAIVDPADAPPRPTLEVAEHGVVLATSAVDLGFPMLVRPVPVRVFVDGPRMPTNASRSEVRQDVHPISTALRRAQALLPEAAELLAAELTGGAREKIDRARAAALLLVAAERHRDSGLGLGRLRDLPLARNAVGMPRPLSAGWSELVHTGSSPFPDELAPWLADVLWTPPGDPSACLVDRDTVDAHAVKRHVRWARREHRAQRRFYGHAPRPQSVELRERPRIRARLGATAPGSAVDPRGIEGLGGEVCILARGDGGELVVLLAGREIERVTYASPIPFAAVIDSPRLVPADRYRSVARDAEYARVEAAMRAGVLCAIEAIAGDASDGFVHGEPDPAADRRLALDGLSLALALELQQAIGAGVLLGGPLLDAPLWRISGGDGWVSTTELRRQAVIGMTAPNARLRPLARRCIVEAELRDQVLLAALLPGTARIVPYDADFIEPGPLYSIDLAQELFEEGGLALALRAEGCAAAIAPSPAARVVISHMGRRVEERAYQPALVSCTILVDGDDIVPDASWRAVTDDAGAARCFAAWELELLRAAAAALVGTRVPDLLGTMAVELQGQLGRALWAALAARDPDQLLGKELAAQLRARPLWRLLGEREPVSARDLAARFPGELPYLATGDEPIEGFTPLVADEVLARAVGRLAGRAVCDAAAELARRRRAAERDAKLAQLRAGPALPLELPGGGICVRRETSQMRAVVGVGRGEAMELELRVEGRPLATLRRAGELPVAAIVDVPIDRLDEDFAALPPAFEGALIHSIRAAVPELLGAIAKAEPAALADLGPVRTLLAAALGALYLDQASREALAATAAFPTVQGPRVSLARAAGGGVISTASWEGEWLGPEAGEAPSALDHPVLYVLPAADELHAVISRLHRYGSVDLTEAIDKLQAQRRMARGLLPRPTVPGVAPELKRRLEDIGPAGAALGPGEIGLVDEEGSTLLIHVRGELRERVPIDLQPPVQLAIEAPELVMTSGAAGTLRPQALLVTVLLVKAVVDQVPVLPVWLRHRLRRALLSDRAVAELERVPLFETAAGAWIDRAAVARQAEELGDVWCLPRPVADPTPLDPRRIVLMLGADEQARARRRDLECIDATLELELDAKARANLARPRPAQLALDPAISALATVALDGDGRTAPRGVVAALAPGAAIYRGLHAHRELYPFDPLTDECLWPTCAVVDDARLAPDRTRSRPARDDAWEALVTAIRKASDSALRDLARPSPRALVSQIVSFSVHADLAALRGDTATQIRGALWLDSAPGSPGQIDIVHTYGSEAYVAPRGIAMRGTLYLFGSLHDLRIREAIGELCEAVHARMLIRLATRSNPPDLATAHVAYGIAIGRLAAADAKAIRFGCFRSRPIDAAEWEALCRSSQTVPLVAPDAVVDELSVTDDGTATARIVLGVLAGRASRDRLPPIPAAPSERFAAVLRDAPSARPAHPLDPLVTALDVRLRRLGLGPQKFAILEDVVSPIACYSADVIALAGHYPRLRAIAAALVAKTAWSEAAVDALAAHVVTVLNIALTSVTDATEAYALGCLLRGT